MKIKKKIFNDSIFIELTLSHFVIRIELKMLPKN